MQWLFESDPLNEEITHFFCCYRSAFLFSARLIPFVCLHFCNLEKVPFRFLSTPESAWFLAQRLVIFQSQLVFRLLCLRNISGWTWSPLSHRMFSRQWRFSQGRRWLQVCLYSSTFPSCCFLAIYIGTGNVQSLTRCCSWHWETTEFSIQAWIMLLTVALPITSGLRSQCGC